jgi:uncharacterized protein (DUF2384 family)
LTSSGKLRLPSSEQIKGIQWLQQGSVQCGMRCRLAGYKPATNMLQFCYSSPVSSSALASRPLAREAVYLHDVAQLSDADIARATGVSRSTARAWLSHTRSPTGQRAERLIELSALVERLARVMDTAYISVWLRKPVPALHERKPIDLIASGKYLRVAELVSALEEAPFS